MASMGDLGEDPRQLRSYMYGQGNLGGLSIFSGGFINYGFWPSHMDPERELTVDDRTLSQAALYRQVVARLDIGAEARLLEVGCGLGVGANLVEDEYPPARVIGVDLSAEQLARAVQSSPVAGFARGSATELPLADDQFDGVYCVEAAQHFDDHPGFIAEAARVLLPGGRFVVAGFFSPTAEVEPQLAEMLETVGNGIDIVAPVEGFADVMGDLGFNDITTESIGARVWKGLDAWMAQTEHHDTWGRNWLVAYERGWVDYFLIHGTMPR